MSSPAPDMLLCLMSLFLPQPPRPLGPARPSWSLSANPHTPLRPPGLQSLPPGDPRDLPAASPWQPTPGRVRSVVPEPSFLRDVCLHPADTASGPSYPLPRLKALMMWPHFAHLDSNIHPQLPGLSVAPAQPLLLPTPGPPPQASRAHHGLSSPHTGPPDHRCVPGPAQLAITL